MLFPTTLLAYYFCGTAEYSIREVVASKNKKKKAEVEARGMDY